MYHRIVQQVVAVAILLATAQGAVAGKKGPEVRDVHHLRAIATESVLCSHEWRVCLASPIPARFQQPTESGWSDSVLLFRWIIDAPTLTSEAGTLLAREPSEEAPFLVLATEESSRTEWTFDLIHRETPYGNPYPVGNQAYTFRLLAAGGPYKGQFIGVEPLSPERKVQQGKVTVFRQLKLVKDRQEAVIFVYVEKQYSYNGRSK